MPDDTPAETPEPPKRRKASPPPVQSSTPSAEPTPEEKPAASPKQAPEWLRYVGQTAAVFLDLGGEIEPGQVVHPRDAALAEVLLARGDFEAADAPSDADSGTAN